MKKNLMRRSLVALLPLVVIAMGSLAQAITPQQYATLLLTGVGRGGAPAFSLTFQSSAGSSTNSTTVDFGTLSYGSGCTRVVLGNVWLAPSGVHSITGITIGGTALSQVSGAFKNQGSVAVDVWESSAALAGSSGDVQVTYSAATGGIGASVALYCLITNTPVAGTPGTASVACCGTSALGAPAVTIPASGAALALTVAQNGHTQTFTNATVDATVIMPPFSVPAYYGHTTSTGSITVTATYSTGDGIVISVTPWGP